MPEKKQTNKQKAKKQGCEVGVYVFNHSTQKAEAEGSLSSKSP